MYYVQHYNSPTETWLTVSQSSSKVCALELAKATIGNFNSGTRVTTRGRKNGRLAREHTIIEEYLPEAVK